MTHRSLIKFAPLTTLERINSPHWVDRGRTMYDPGALRFLPNTTRVPVLIDHDEQREIGFVDELTRVDWTDGPWLAGLATIEDAPAWLKPGTRVSFEYKVLGKSDWRGCEILRHGIVTEISVLSPGVTPKEPRAEVLTLSERTPDKPPPTTTIKRAVPANTARARDRFSHFTDQKTERFIELLRGGMDLDGLIDYYITHGRQ